MNPLDSYFMEKAIEEAKKAYKFDEVPVGAIVVKDFQIIGRGRNLNENLKDPTAHAEILAIREASSVLNNWRLNDTTIYVTLEPCLMCLGAIFLARIKRLVFATRETKNDALGKIVDILLNDNSLFNQLEVNEGVLKEESQYLLQSFFSKVRTRNKFRRGG